MLARRKRGGIKLLGEQPTPCDLRMIGVGKARCRKGERLDEVDERRCVRLGHRALGPLDVPALAGKVFEHANDLWVKDAVQAARFKRTAGKRVDKLLYLRLGKVGREVKLYKVTRFDAA